MKKANIFCHSFQKVKPIYYIDSLHRVKKKNSCNFDDYGLQIMKTQYSVSRKTLIKLKKDILNRNVRLL